MLDDRHKSSSVKAPPFFSNLQPEGGLRKSIAQRLKIHEVREFLLLSALGEDLPGAVILKPAETPARVKVVVASVMQPMAEYRCPPNAL